MRPYHIKLFMTGFLSLLFYLGMTYLSKEFNWGEGYARRPIVEYLLLYFGLFVIYSFSVYWTLKAREDTKSLIIIFIAGIAFRAILIPSQQIQEDDIYRYLWDGKTFGNQINPYKFSPDQVTYFKQFMIREPSKFNSTYDEQSIRDLERLATLKWENEKSLVFMERINHPTLPTIYPPMAQYVFSIIYKMRPDSIVAMRLGFLVFDLMAAGFILLILGALAKKRTLVIIYFWSPLIIKETFNSTHLDIIGIGLLCGAIYFLVRSRFLASNVFLALSVLGKLYPVVLFPFFLREQFRRLGSDWSRLVFNSVVFAGTIGICYLPFLDIGTRVFSSLKSFSTYWQSNDSLFAVLVWFYRDVVGIAPKGPIGLSYDEPSLWAKGTVAIILVSVWGCLFLQKKHSNHTAKNEHPALDCLRHLFIIMGLIFLLSPVQNPWYLGWVVPFICIFPGRSWLLLTGLMGFYYLEFYFDYQEMQQYVQWIPWVEYLPFYLLLFWDWRQRQSSGAKILAKQVPKKS